MLPACEHPNQRRRGAAVVELAVVLPLLTILLLGVWEIGRMLEIQQVLDNGAREGGRQAVARNLTNAQIAQVVLDYLRDAGLPTAQAQVTVQDLDQPGTDAAAAARGDQMHVQVVLPLASVRLTNLYLVTGPTTQLTATAVWSSAKDPY